MPRKLEHCHVCGKRHFVGSGAYLQCHSARNRAASNMSNIRNDVTQEVVSYDHAITQHNLDVLEDYGIYRAVTGTIHNSLEAFKGNELYYYSTDTGQRELERRMNSSWGERHILPLLKEINSLKGQRIPGIDDEMRRKFEIMSDAGYEKTHNGIVFEDNRRDEDIAAYVIRESLKDLSALSVDQVEVISHYTSNGSCIARGKDSFGRDDYSRQEERERIVNTMTDIFDSIEPRNDVPVLYRGTDPAFLPDSVGEKFSFSDDGLPLCTAVSFGNASFFSKGAIVVMEIEEAGMVFPGAVSAWSGKEHEVILDGDTEFEIISIEDSPRESTARGDKIYHVRQVG